ncbi:MAG: SDR family NAD(P)-dependent oxidoreductase [Alphaproteobacteria bacterium]|nr:SDR family NAD(P)-dependent oxidoreductase [Alphaproteobacteria bacterium]MBU0795608.1 SDR family NAD(P)-dependent oxidoreductase [Alphaproteobacteria bacterium]MBU0887665.1 SDR family NAD(P)-dependent oxidoreductase [Alphaproteobacteria bacterium]MBU1812908.1 SDR family NAD(P)-dependent oxidoreductase [Alphaproteobacteria bacterium]
MLSPKTIVITGASSGLGAALAVEYTGPGILLALTGRDADRLEATASACRAKGAEVEAARLDVSDTAAMEAWLLALDNRQPVDLVIANAGISAGTGGAVEPADQARRIFAVNLDGVLNSVLPLIPRMQARKSGQIALMSSLAGFRGFPGAPAYCGSKAAVRVYGEALRGTLAASGVAVNVICPGYVRTAMTARNSFPMPLLMDADKAAALIRRRLGRNAARIAFPWPMLAAVWLLQALPPALIDPLMRRLPAKGVDAD